ncbi:MAG: S8 family serine peptidase [Candidatus Methylacidiphilales bacterium]
MYKKLLSVTVAILLVSQLNAQSLPKVPHRSLLEAKNANELQIIYNENITAELDYAKNVLGLSLAPQVFSDGTVVQLVGISQTGIPRYLKTYNSGAAKTIGTDKAYAGGSLGLSLSGSGLTNRLGVWDGGAVRTTHQEFQGRATQIDGATSLNDHATHVAGTMVAGGFQANAKGMAFQAPLKCYDWTNDNSEMITAAAAGMLISNHSYGNICGWNYDETSTQWRWYGDVSVSSTEDVKFGMYDSESQAWDQIVYNNQFYLPFKAAGNDRGDQPSGSNAKTYFDNNIGDWTPFTGTVPPADGQYDCIATYANAKNIMTIGAVNKITNGWTSAGSVVMSSFSGWGPTDDGRIKPDVCAAGVNLYSSFSASDNTYSTISGTSMATPSASGSALLIQQHYNNLKAKFLRASTLKGLIIQTADEAGTALGPDYSFGWGLMNTAKAVQTITDSGTNNIIEASMPVSLIPYTRTIVTSGSAPIKITICWTDVPASAASGSLLDEATAKLVNDLDVRLIRLSDNVEFLPYILNPATPNAAATTGDNTRDNVEQIVLAAPTAGTYTVKVTSKKALANNAAQPFSLIISGISPKPAANFTSSTKMSCVGSQVTFTNTSVSSTSRIWYFPGGTPSTSTANNPIVTYAVAGNYPVSLKVVGLAGEDSIYLNNYMKIGGLTLPLIETFENYSATAGLWKITNNYANDTLGWRKFTNTLGTSPGNTVYGLNFWDNINSTRRYQIQTPILDFRGMQNANLAFQHAYTRYATTDRDSLVVSISTNCGTSWTRLLGLTETRPNNGARMATFTENGGIAQTSTTPFIPSKAADWCGTDVNGSPCNNINLTPYIGLNNLVIRFEAYFSAGNNLFLDNVNITGTPFSPKAGFTAPSLVCNNQNFTLSDTSKNNPSQWEWAISGPQNLSFTTQNPILNLTTPGVYNVKLKVTNISGTDSTIINNAFEVLPSPVKPTATVSGSLTICDIDSTLITTTASNVQWYRDSVAINGAIGATFYNKLAGKIAVRTFATNGCAAQSDVFTFNTGSKPPVATITKSLSGNVFCEGGSFVLTSNASNSNQWVRNGIDLPNQTNTSLNFNDSGTFNVKVVNGGCFSLSQPLTISKLAKPQTTEILASRFAYKNDTATYSVTGLATSTFTWAVSGGTIQSGQNTNSVVVKWNAGTSGSVQVTEKGTNGCNGATKIYPVGIWNVSVQNIGLNNEIVLYPNPANNYLNVKYLGNSIGTLDVKVFDILGKNVINQTINFANKDEQTIDIAHLPKGIYIVKYSSANFTGNKIITKE